MSDRGKAWIVYPSGRRFGPFESVDLAIQVRVYVERVERREDLAIKTGVELAEEPFRATVRRSSENDD